MSYFPQGYLALGYLPQGDLPLPSTAVVDYLKGQSSLTANKSLNIVGSVAISCASSMSASNVFIAVRSITLTCFTELIGALPANGVATLSCNSSILTSSILKVAQLSGKSSITANPDPTVFGTGTANASSSITATATVQTIQATLHAASTVTAVEYVNTILAGSSTLTANFSVAVPATIASSATVIASAVYGALKCSSSVTAVAINNLSCISSLNAVASIALNGNVTMHSSSQVSGVASFIIFSLADLVCKSSISTIPPPIFGGTMWGTSSAFRWGTKPLLGSQIDLSHDLAQSLQSCLIFNESEGKPYDLINPSRNNWSVTGTSWSVGRDGPALSFNGTSDYLQQNHGVANAIPVTLMAWFNTSSLASQQALLNLAPGGGSNAFLVLQIETTGQVSAVTNDGANGTKTTTSNVSVASGTWNQAAAVFNNEFLRSVYVNGGNRVDNILDSLGPQFGIFYTAVGAFHNATDTLQSFFNGSLGMAMIWNRALTAEEIAWLYQEPYAIFKQPNVRNFQAVQVGGTKLFTVGFGSFVESGQAATLTFNPGQITGVATLVGDATITATAGVSLNGVATMAGDATITATASVSLNGVATMAGDATITATASVLSNNNQATLVCMSGLTAVAMDEVNGTASLVDVTNLIATGVLLGENTSFMGCSSSLAAAAVINFNRSASLAALSSLAAHGFLPVQGSANLHVLSALAATAVVNIVSSANLYGVSSLSGLESIHYVGIANLLSVSDLEALVSSKVTAGKPNLVVYMYRLPLTLEGSVINSANTAIIYTYSLSDGSLLKYVPGGSNNDFTQLDNGSGSGRGYWIVPIQDFDLVGIVP